MSSGLIHRAAVTAAAAATSAGRVQRAAAAAAGGSRGRVHRAAAAASSVLIANAGRDQSVKGLQRVILDGSASTASSGTILQWEWLQDAGPTVTLDFEDTMYAAFTAPGILRDGATIQVRLRIRDVNGWSTPAYQTVTVARHRTFRTLPGGGRTPYVTTLTPQKVANVRPIASIGPNKTVTTGTSTTVGGTDVDNDGSIIDWRFTTQSGPAQLTFAGSGPTRTITPTVAGTYVLAKVVVDGYGALSVPDTMVLTVVNGTTTGGSIDTFQVGVTKPVASNTGPQKPITKTHAGDWIITVPGVYEGYDVTGFVNIRVDGVTFRHNRVRGRNVGSTGAGGGLINTGTNQPNTVVEFNEIYYEPAVGWENDNAALVACGAFNVNGMAHTSGVARRNNIHHVIDGAQIYKDNVTFEANYVWGNLHLTDDPNWQASANRGSHDDGLQIQGGVNITLRGNNIEGAYNGGMALVTQDVAPTTNLVIDRNWGGGGAATINVSEKGRGALQGLRITDNRFYGTSRLVGFEILIPATTRAVAVITGNVMDATGAPANIRNG